MKKTRKAEQRAERSVINRCLAEIWPHLLAASNASDGPNPAQAASCLAKAGDILKARAAEVRS